MTWQKFLVGILVTLLIITIFLFLKRLDEKNTEYLHLNELRRERLRALQNRPVIHTEDTIVSNPNITLGQEVLVQEPAEIDDVAEIDEEPLPDPAEVQAQIMQQTVRIVRPPGGLPDIDIELVERMRAARRHVAPETTPALRVVNRNNRQQYYEDLEKHDNSPQNAHDKQINIYLKRKYTKLVEVLNREKLPEGIEDGLDPEELEQLRIDHSFMEIRQRAEEYINMKEYLDETARRIEIKKIDMILKKIARGYTITSISASLKPVKENLVLSQVWRRIHQDDNKKNMLELEVALIDSLLDGVERKSQLVNALGDLFMIMAGQQAPQTDFDRNYSTVCINGRVSRMLASLTILDADDELAKPVMDLAEVRNEAYMKASKIADDIFGEQTKEFKEFYLKDDGDLTTEQEFQIQSYEKTAKDKIREELTKDYEHLISKSELEETIINAQAGVNSEI